ncbi:MAG: hypothetical protein Q9200_004660 [Gallowayella weberi]
MPAIMLYESALFVENGLIVLGTDLRRRWPVDFTGSETLLLIERGEGLMESILQSSPSSNVFEPSASVVFASKTQALVDNTAQAFLSPLLAKKTAVRVEE